MPRKVCMPIRELKTNKKKTKKITPKGVTFCYSFSSLFKTLSNGSQKPNAGVSAKERNRERERKREKCFVEFRMQTLAESKRLFTLLVHSLNQFSEQINNKLYYEVRYEFV